MNKSKFLITCFACILKMEDSFQLSKRKNLVIC